MEKLAPSVAESQSRVGEAEGRIIPALGSPPKLQTQPWVQPQWQQPLGHLLHKAERSFPSPSFGTSMLQGQFPSDSEVARGWLCFGWRGSIRQDNSRAA